MPDAPAPKVELKPLPCPCCGTDVRLEGADLDDDPVYWVTCGCGIETQLKLSADEVIAIWNRRPASAPSALSGEVEA